MPPSAAPPPVQESSTVEVEVTSSTTEDGEDREVGIVKEVKEATSVKWTLEPALNRACDKFRRRFTYLEEQTLRKGRSLHDMTLAEMDAIWDEGKAKGL